MSYLLVPHEASSDAATVWAGVYGNAPADRMVVATASAEVPLGAWQRFPDSDAALVRYQRARITGLAPRQSYRVELRRDGQPLAAATLRTLPDRASQT